MHLKIHCGNSKNIFVWLFSEIIEYLTNQPKALMEK